MKFDRNTVLGFVILAILFIGYFWYNNKQIAASREQEKVKLEQQKHIKDSIDLVNKPIEDSLKRHEDSVAKVNNTGGFIGVADSTEKTFQLQNNLVIATFTNKGGQIKQV